MTDGSDGSRSGVADDAGVLELPHGRRCESSSGAVMDVQALLVLTKLTDDEVFGSAVALDRGDNSRRHSLGGGRGGDSREPSPPRLVLARRNGDFRGRRRSCWFPV